MGKMPAIGLIGLMGAGFLLTGCDSVKGPGNKTYTTGSTWQSKPLFGGKPLPQNGVAPAQQGAVGVMNPAAPTAPAGMAATSPAFGQPATGNSMNVASSSSYPYGASASQGVSSSATALNNPYGAGNSATGLNSVPSGIGSSGTGLSNAGMGTGSPALSAGRTSAATTGFGSPYPGTSDSSTPLGGAGSGSASMSAGAGSPSSAIRTTSYEAPPPDPVSSARFPSSPTGSGLTDTGSTGGKRSLTPPPMPTSSLGSSSTGSGQWGGGTSAGSPLESGSGNAPTVSGLPGSSSTGTASSSVNSVPGSSATSSSQSWRPPFNPGS